MFSKPLTAFHFNTSKTLDSGERRMNYIVNSNINPWKEYWPSRSTIFEKVYLVFNRAKNFNKNVRLIHTEKRENYGHQHFFLSPTMFSAISNAGIIRVISKLSSVHVFKLVQKVVLEKE